MSRPLRLLLVLCVVAGLVGSSLGCVKETKTATGVAPTAISQSEPTPAAPQPSAPLAAGANGAGTPTDGYKAWATPAEYAESTGKSLPAYTSPPSLRDKEAAGLLPPVAERLPAEPCVLQPQQEIGQYGGVFRRASPYAYVLVGSMAHLVKMDLQSNYVMWLAKGWEVSEDLSQLTVYLRRGAKWSDGKPFTADDVLFWWEDIMLNPELTPVLDQKYQPGGQPMSVTKVDDYTVAFKVAEGYYGIRTLINKGAWEPLEYAPKHYLQQYHSKYNPDADALAKQNGFDHWWQLFQAKNKPFNMGMDGIQTNPEMPSMNPWIVRELAADKIVLERNPYFWAVDTMGNQLPYIDQHLQFFTGAGQAAEMKLLAGELDYADIDVGEIPIYKPEEAKAGFRVITTYMGNELAWPNVVPNLSLQDPVLGPIFRDVRFRRALSLAIDRQEINDFYFGGLGVPCQNTMNRDNPLYKPEWGQAWAEYNVDEANRLLDEMNLPWDAAHQFRLRPDGQRLSIIFELEEWSLESCEPIKKQWEKIGVEVQWKVQGEAVYFERIKTNEGHMFSWTTWANNSEELYAKEGAMTPGSIDTPWGVPWEEWYQSNGQAGLEPPDWAKQYFEYRQKWMHARNEQEYIRWGQALFDWVAEYIPVIGTVGYPPTPVVVSSRLRNVMPRNIGMYETELWMLQLSIAP
ncbi:MAG: ABC transporter substrate-binding protein [Anaerolineae bacterium]